MFYTNLLLTIIALYFSAFHVDSDGNVFVKNESLLNVTVAHLVAIATDNGSPPRQSSVPVEIVVPEEVLMHAGSLGFESTHALVIIFGVCLGILFVVIVILAAHIAKRFEQKSLLDFGAHTAE